jgi:hypothetical protein
MRAAFKTWDGKIITGKIIAILSNGLYLVIGDNGTCGMFGDGLFRFIEKQRIK